MSICQFENNIKNFRDIDCGCLTFFEHEYADVTVRIQFFFFFFVVCYYICIFTCFKSYSLAKKILIILLIVFVENGLIQVRGDGENAAFQIADEVNSSQIPPSPESIDDGTENTEKNHVQQNKEKDCTTMETFKYDPSAMNEKLDWICAEIEKIKEFQAAVESKFTKLELTNTTPVQPVELNTFNEVDMTPR